MDCPSLHAPPPTGLADEVCSWQVRVPRQGDGFDIEFSPPAGLERVFVFGVKQPMERWGDLASIQNTTQRGEALTRAMVTKAAAPSASVASFQLTFQLYE